MQAPIFEIMEIGRGISSYELSISTPGAQLPKCTAPLGVVSPRYDDPAIDRPATAATAAQTTATSSAPAPPRRPANRDIPPPQQFPQTQHGLNSVGVPVCLACWPCLVWIYRAAHCPGFLSRFAGLRGGAGAELVAVVWAAVAAAVVHLPTSCHKVSKVPRRASSGLPVCSAAPPYIVRLWAPI